ncbi:flagellar hook-associated family protein [Aquibium microcysteis]|uniref:flagellar hook-associated family protein n=1 Tax=Aquibium microcysteis TaxID=675281 RepID=UPI00165CF1C5|nr:flagellar hook-associated family protein [Aquibium microcysteis]
MKVNFVSTDAIRSALRYSLTQMQSDLIAGQKEVQTGKVADLGLSIGVRSGKAVTLSRDIVRMETIVGTNALVSSRLTATQNALGQVSEGASTFLSALAAAVSGDADQATTRQAAVSMLQSLTGIVNSSFNGEHIFAGVNTDVVPMADYFDASVPGPKAAIDAAFLSEFGFAADDPAADTVTGAQITAFIDGALSDEFFGSGWETNWSAASDQGITTRIALNETAETSVSANIEGIRKLTMAAAMVANLFDGDLNDQALVAVADRAVRMVGEAMGDLAQTQARVGFTEQRISSATERVEMQIDIFKTFLNELEGVDPYEASTRVNALISQIETSYALTARIQQLSLTRLL